LNPDLVGKIKGAIMLRLTLVALVSLIVYGCMLLGQNSFDPDFELANDGDQWVVSAAKAEWSESSQRSVQISFRGAAAERVFELMTAAPEASVDGAIERLGAQITCRHYSELKEPGGDPLYVCALDVSEAGKVSGSKITSHEVPLDLSDAAVTVELPGDDRTAHIRIGTKAGKDLFTWLARDRFAQRRFVEGDIYCLGFSPRLPGGKNQRIFRCGATFTGDGSVIAPSLE
jgi:hypothetical protein